MFSFSDNRWDYICLITLKLTHYIPLIKMFYFILLAVLFKYFVKYSLVLNIYFNAYMYTYGLYTHTQTWCIGLYIYIYIYIYQLRI